MNSSDIGLYVSIFAAVLAVLLAVVEHKKIISFFRSLFFNHKVLVHGPPDGGKTTLIHYLKTGTFSANIKKNSTVETVRNISFGLTPDTFERLRIKRSVEVGGQYENYLIGEIRKLDPEALVFVFAWDQQGAAQAALADVATALEALASENAFGERQLNSLLLIMNQTDRMTPQDISPGVALDNFEKFIGAELRRVQKCFPDISLIVVHGSIKEPAQRLSINEGLRRLASRMRDS